MKKVRFGRIHADHLTFSGAINEIARLVERGKGGYVVTPNVDHVVIAETDERLQRSYADASLSLVDGMPLLWLARLMGHPLPEKISGSDITLPLMERAASSGWRVYFLGAIPGVGQAAADSLQAGIPGLKIVGIDAPDLGFEKAADTEQSVLDRVRTAKPDIVLVALGCPKQELLMHQWRDVLAPSVMLGIGATLDYIAGNVSRAPVWMSQIGAEWIYRIAQDPRRMMKRYLVRDRAIWPIALRMLRMPKAERAFEDSEGR